MSVLMRLVQPFAELVRWGEPWDIEEDDPMLDGPGGTEQTLSLWT